MKKPLENFRLLPKTDIMQMLMGDEPNMSLPVGDGDLGILKDVLYVPSMK